MFAHIKHLQILTAYRKCVLMNAYGSHMLVLCSPVVSTFGVSPGLALLKSQASSFKKTLSSDTEV